MGASTPPLLVLYWVLEPLLIAFRLFWVIVYVDVDFIVDVNVTDEAARDQARPSSYGGLRFPLRRGVDGEERGRRGTPALGICVRLQPQVGA